MSAGRVLVVGSVNVDVTVAVATLPRPGETVTGGRYAERDGGKGANQAVAAARAGAATAFVGAVGDDPHGHRARAALVAAGVDVGALDTVAAPTGVALIVVADDGENQIAVASGANHALDAAEVAAAVAAHVDREADGAPAAVLLLGLELLDAPLLAAARAAAGLTVVLNPAPARPFDPALLDLGPLLTPNEHEAATLTGEREPIAAARALATRTGAPVVVTLGVAGALLAEPNAEPVHVRAPAVEAVDTTGAGDVFNGALAAALAAGAPLRAAVADAVAAASASVKRPGARG